MNFITVQNKKNQNKTELSSNNQQIIYLFLMNYKISNTKTNIQNYRKTRFRKNLKLT